MFKNEHMKVSGCFFLVSLNSSKMSVLTPDVVSGVKGRLSTRGAFERFPIDSFVSSRLVLKN